MRALLLLILFGLASGSCTRTTPPTESSVKTAHHPLLSSPAEAEDLDPDPNVIHVRLTATALPDPSGGFVYAYNGQNPGPVIRGKVGDRLIVDLDNQLDAATTIHWHGVKVPFAMDGVAWMGAPVQVGEGFRYEFDLPHTGTYWYHPHFNTERQVDGGLYGLLIIEDPDDPVPDEELLLIFDTANEFDPEIHALEDGLEGRPAHGHGTRRPLWRVNGLELPASHRLRGGQTVRARMVNASNHSFLNLSWPGIRHIGGDQGLLPAMQSPDSIVLAPGDRADVEFLVGDEDLVLTEAPWSINGGRTYQPPHEFIRFEVEDPQAAPPGLPWPFPGGEVSPDPAYTDLLYVFSGSDRTGIWLINGERFPEVTVKALDFGAEAIIEVRNLSPTEHPFHLHGLNFEVLSVNGDPPAYKTIEDTWNLRIRDQLRIRVIADNPGYWMTHCHILPHAHDGMMTVLEVREP